MGARCGAFSIWMSCGNDLILNRLSHFYTRRPNYARHFVMSAPKYLIDTNVIIGLEDWKEVSPEFAALTQLAARHAVGIFVHEAARDDIARDSDVARRKVSLSKIAKYPLIA